MKKSDFYFDLPQELIKELEISINPFTVITQEGVFLDGIDIDADELISYIGEENRMVTSDPASEETFIRFYYIFTVIPNLIYFIEMFFTYLYIQSSWKWNKTQIFFKLICVEFLREKKFRLSHTGCNFTINFH